MKVNASHIVRALTQVCILQKRPSLQKAISTNYKTLLSIRIGPICKQVSRFVLSSKQMREMVEDKRFF